MSKQHWVGIDGNEANVVRRVGSNVYAYELLCAMYTHLHSHRDFCVRVYLSGPKLEDLPPATSWWEYRILPPARLWTQWRLPLDLFFRCDLDFFFSPGHYLPRFSPVPVMASIMDLAFLSYPEQFKRKDAWQLTTLTERSVRQSTHLIAISEHTKKDIVQKYHYPSDRITVAYPAASEGQHLSQEEVAQTLKEQGISQPYIAFIGTLQPRKNIERLVAAFEILRERGRTLQLVLVGKTGWLGEPIQQRIESSSYVADIRQTGFVTDQQRQAIMQGAAATVLVGLYEGFGIPPLESILAGTLPIVSQTSSLPEVVGPDGILVDPLEPTDIARGIEDVLRLSEAERRQMVGRLQKYVQKFSWKKSGQTVCATIASQLKQRQ